MNVRDRFFSKVLTNVRKGKDIMIVSSDLGAPSLDEYRKEFPNRFVNVGIAEQNSIAVAGGLCMAGKTAITYGLNPFPVTRAYDQIRNIMASLKIPVTVAALKAGTSSAEAGLSHMALENISILRTLKNIRIISPSDETISQKAVLDIMERPMPRYIQFDPFIYGAIYDEKDIDFNKGFVTNKKESNITIVTSGIWANILNKENLDNKIIDCYSLPIDEEGFIEEIKESKKIITIEDGVAAGGIGSMVLEILNDHNVTIPVRRMALRFDDGYPEVLSDRNMIFKKEDLTIEKIKELVTEDI